MSRNTVLAAVEPRTFALPQKQNRHRLLPQIPGYRVCSCISVREKSSIWRVETESGAVYAAKIGSRADLSREYAALQSCAHTHVVAAYELLPCRWGDPPADGGAVVAGESLLDADVHNASAALIMDYLPGGSLHRLIKGRGSLHPGEVVTAITPIAEAVSALHSQGWVHGDISAGNVLLTAAGKPVLADFQYARPQTARSKRGRKRKLSVGVAPLATGKNPREKTGPYFSAERGHTAGTSGYISPEILEGSAMSPAAEVYALGALAWMALTGETPADPWERGELADVVSAPAEAISLVEAAVNSTPLARPDAFSFAVGLYSAIAAKPLPMPASAGPAEERISLGPLTMRLVDQAVGTLNVPPSVPRKIWKKYFPLFCWTAQSLLRPRLWKAVFSPVLRGGTSSLIILLGLVTASANIFAHALDAGVLTTAEPSPVIASSSNAESKVGGATNGSGTPDDLPQGSSLAHKAKLPGKEVAGVPAALDIESAFQRAKSRQIVVRPVQVKVSLEQIKSLFTRRSQAWNNRNTAGLARVFAPGSPAGRQDHTALQTAQERGYRYVGIKFLVSNLRAENPPDTARQYVRISVDVAISAYTVRQGESSEKVAALAPQKTVMLLVRSGSHWRIWRWED